MLPDLDSGVVLDNGPSLVCMWLIAASPRHSSEDVYFLLYSITIQSGSPQESKLYTSPLQKVPLTELLLFHCRNHNICTGREQTMVRHHGSGRCGQRTAERNSATQLAHTQRSCGSRLSA